MSQLHHSLNYKYSEQSLCAYEHVMSAFYNYGAKHKDDLNENLKESRSPERV